MMDPDMFAEDPSFVEEFDIDFEFDAPRFYDFSKPELDSETEETELWFESAGNYPPSPFSLNLSCTFDDKHLKIPKPVTDKYNGFIYYNQTANNVPKATQKSKTKPFLRKNSTLTRPTASLLARQNKPLDIYSVQLLTRCQRSLGKLESKISPSILLSMPQTQDTKRQKLESGFLRKISRLEQTPFVHKVPKKVSKVTVPKEPNLKTAQRATKLRFKASSAPEQVERFSSTMNKTAQESYLTSLHRSQDFHNFGSCRYTVIIRTSCSSPRYTRDQISLSFGDGYRNQVKIILAKVYAPRLDDPGSRAFERCSSDTYEINGPCVRQICYVYVHRSGPDGWVPESVQIFSHSSKAVTVTFNTHVPESIWFGHNYCNTI
ncbi:hypothetical protein DY000_02000301 [Brassica cretica]|uniref:TPX2 central domain-containing protein n=1 Tax=Brassica cretica TaxID=69181 RepID=A0ABQ7C3R5_BRACR|nr:hypothetical protein DY000_02000301 [Brassica cretica]